jgi:hypothetical protein
VTHGFGGWDSAPGCIQHHLPASDGVYKPYQACADFFTFGHGSTVGTLSTGVNSSYWILTVLGVLAMIGFLIWWVVLEDRKLTTQAAHLLQVGMGATGGSPPPAAGTTRSPDGP